MVVICQNNDLLMLGFSNKIVTYNNTNSVLKQHAITASVQNNTEKPPSNMLNNQLNNIICMAVSSDGLYTVCATENKQLIVFNKNFIIIQSGATPRTASKVCFSPENHILVADKTGDVLKYKLNELTSPPTVLLGHLSIIFDMVISKCGKYLITCDRDEKIRVSSYPNTYNIVSYCFGHSEFVSSIKLLENNILLSASGDGTIRMWNYLKGEELNKIDTSNLVNEKILNEFVVMMKDNKITANTLPIIDMQVSKQCGNSVFIAIQLSQLTQIHLFTLNVDTLNSTYFTNIEIDTNIFKFFLNDKFYVITKKMTVYTLHSAGVKQSQEDLGLKTYEELFQLNPIDCTLFYKKKFDNMHSYFEKKKRRLESDQIN